MFTVFFICSSLTYLAYRYYSNRNRYWAKRGIRGPEPELLFGNLRSVWSYDNPRPLVLKEWTKQFGKVYGYLSGQRPFWVISDPTLISEIFVKRFDNFYAHARAELQESEDCAGTHMAEARGGHWKRLRTLSTDAFSNKAMRNIFPTIKNSAELMAKLMEKQNGAEIDALRHFREYTMDIISKVALGISDNKMFENGYVGWCTDFFLKPLSHWMFALPSLFPSLVDFWRLCVILSSVFIDFPVFTLAREIKKTVQERKKQRESGAPPTNDIIDMFLDAEADVGEVDFGADGQASKMKVRNKLSLDEIVVNIKLFLLAGYDTTSITLARAVHFLANEIEIQERLREEINDVIGTDDFDLEDIGNLSYTEAVVKETLRHHPLGSGFTTRECTASCEIGGYTFEKGDMIMPDVWSLQMDKEVWGEDAEEFRPERWLNHTTRDRAAYLAFGEGPRICLGMKMALIEAKVALIVLMRSFKIEKTQNTNPLKMVGSFLVAFDKVQVAMAKRG